MASATATRKPKKPDSKSASKKRGPATGAAPKAKPACREPEPSGKALAGEPTGRPRPERKKPPRSTSVPDLEIGPDELELIAAIDRFKKTHNRPFPSWSEVLHVLKGLGYRKG